jgi:hypothetical protein
MEPQSKHVWEVSAQGAAVAAHNIVTLWRASRQFRHADTA